MTYLALTGASIMTPNPPAHLAEAIGLAMWHLSGQGGPVPSGQDVIERILARGFAGNREEARAALRQARSNLTAAARVQQSSTGRKLGAACGYRCPDSTPIALRIVFEAVTPQGQPVGLRSVVIQSNAGEKLSDVLARAQGLISRRFRASNTRYGYSLRAAGNLAPADVAQVLIGYKQGTP